MFKSQSALKLLRVLLVATSVSILLYLVAQIGIGELFSHLSSMHLGWLLLALLCMALVFCFATLRYQCLIAKDLPFFSLLEVILSGFILNYAAMVQGLGLGAKIAMLKTKQVPVSNSSAGIWLEICLDILVCSAIVMLFMFTVFDSGSVGPVVIAIPLVIIIAVSLVFVVIYRFPGRLKFADQFVSAFRDVSSVRRLTVAIIYTVGIWVSAAAGFYCILSSLQPGASAELGLSILAMASGFLTGLVSMIPGGIGVRELTWTYVINQGGYPLELAGLAAILNRLFAILIVSATLSAISFAKARSS